MAQNITAKILRFDPSVDAAPHFEEYDVPWIEDESNIVTGLQVLKYVNENIEPITFDSCCYCSICGRCSIMIDGTPCLACATPLLPGKHAFEPLRGFPVIRDLIVETDRAYTRFVDSVMENQTVEPIKTLCNYDYDFYWEVLDRMSTCRECLCCYAACPALQERGAWDTFIGPGAMMQIGLRHLDGRDQSDRILQAVTSGLFQCDLCGECAAVCSSHIDIVGVVDIMQRAAAERGLVPANAVTRDYRVPDGASPIAYDGDDAEGLTASETCAKPECHDATTISHYKRDAALADLRVESHVKKKAAVTDAQAAALKSYFTKQ